MKFKRKVFLVAMFLLLCLPSAGSAVTCGQNPRYCKSEALCILSTSKSDSGALIWSKSFSDYGAEARRRGLGCGVVPDRPPSKLQLYFTRQITEEDRRTIQLYLKELNLYAAPVDGLYGPGTEKALRYLRETGFSSINLDDPDDIATFLQEIIKRHETQRNEQRVEQLVETTSNEDISAPNQQVQLAPTIIDMNAAFAAGNYTEAKQMAEALALDGNAEAQYHLGLMYRDGLGILQLSKHAHMWFNIASMLGHKEAGDAREALASTIGPANVAEAQEMALLCIQSDFTDCGLTKVNRPKYESTLISGVDLREPFLSLSLTKRQQIHYALRAKGFYSSSIDGLWGQGTLSAFNAYLERTEASPTEAQQVFQDVLSGVQVPAKFEKPATPKRRVSQTGRDSTNRSYNTAGLIAIVPNPSLPGAQALAVCQPQADIARSGNYSGGGGSAYNCTGFGNTLNCRQDGWSQLGDALAGAITARKTAKKVLASCLAQYGWRKP